MDPLLASACSFLDQARSPPPSLRDILRANSTKGDGDRDMLLAVLNAKTAEDQVCLLLFTVLSPHSPHRDSLPSLPYSTLSSSSSTYVLPVLPRSQCPRNRSNPRPSPSHSPIQLAPVLPRNNLFWHHHIRTCLTLRQPQHFLHASAHVLPALLRQRPLAQPVQRSLLPLNPTRKSPHPHTVPLMKIHHPRLCIPVRDCPWRSDH